jgi:hypothetical protein
MSHVIATMQDESIYGYGRDGNYDGVLPYADTPLGNLRKLNIKNARRIVAGDSCTFILSDRELEDNTEQQVDNTNTTNTNVPQRRPFFGLF